jgi:transcriptional regulator with XRE-family HTH domain
VVSGDLLREARKRAGLTQAELGRRVGKPQSSIARWERGDVKPSLETLRELIRACGLELTFAIANYDDSYVSQIREALSMTPRARLEEAAWLQRSIEGWQATRTRSQGWLNPGQSSAKRS